mgnify:CR=1 FL=1
MWVDSPILSSPLSPSLPSSLPLSLLPSLLSLGPTRPTTADPPPPTFTAALLTSFPSPLLPPSLDAHPSYCC